MSISHNNSALLVYSDPETECISSCSYGTSTGMHRAYEMPITMQLFVALTNSVPSSVKC